jgi:TRAP transporter TAXI family solute receptor
MAEPTSNVAKAHSDGKTSALPTAPASSFPSHRPKVSALLKAGDFDALTDRELYRLIAVAVLLLVAFLLVFFSLINPGPPKTLVMSTGSSTGAYHAMAQDYQQRLKAHGIHLEIVESTGSLQNLDRLRKQEKILTSKGQELPVMAAFVQSGTSTEDDVKQEWIESLASVAFEPIWVFHRLGKNVQRLADLTGRKIAVGAPGSGVQFAARKLLEKTGINESNSQLLPLGADQALSALLDEQVDAIVLIAAPSAKAVTTALDRNLSLLNFAQADAYLRNFPWLQKVTLPRGSVNLAKDLPAQDITLIAATANLAVSAELHPSLAFLLLDTASDIHSKASLTQTLKEFPSERALEFKQSAESKRYFKTGRPFLQQYLPFWLANLIERLMTSVVPILVILLPLIKLVPAFFAWREKARVSRLYSEVRHIEEAYVQQNVSAAQAHSALSSIEVALDGLEPNSPDLASLYQAKAHLGLVRAKIPSPL